MRAWNEKLRDSRVRLAPRFRFCTSRDRVQPDARQVHPPRQGIPVGESHAGRTLAETSTGNALAKNIIWNSETPGAPSARRHHDCLGEPRILPSSPDHVDGPRAPTGRTPFAGAGIPNGIA